MYQGGQPYYPPQNGPRKHVQADVAMWLGLASLLLAPITGAFAIIVSRNVLAEIKAAKGQLTGEVQVYAGLVATWIGSALAMMLGFRYVAHSPIAGIVLLLLAVGMMAGMAVGLLLATAPPILQRAARLVIAARAYSSAVALGVLVGLPWGLADAHAESRAADERRANEKRVLAEREADRAARATADALLAKTNQDARDADNARRRDHAREALAAFRAASGGTAEARFAAYRTAVDALAVAPEPIANAPVPSAPVDALIAQINKLDADDVVTAEPVAPEYSGAFSLSGTVRQCFKDGVALEAYDGKFYFLHDAKCPDLPNLYGTVENTGRTVDLDIGRAGRTAKVVEISDKEKENDDRAEHQREMVSYQSELNAYRARVAGKPVRAAERTRLLRAVDDVLLPLSMKAAD